MLSSLLLAGCAMAPQPPMNASVIGGGTEAYLDSLPEGERLALLSQAAETACSGTAGEEAAESEAQTPRPLQERRHCPLAS